MSAEKRKLKSPFALLSTMLIGICVASTFQGCGPSSGISGNRVTLILGAYTAPREAYAKAIIPAFQKYWKEKTGQDVEFQPSYNGSGAQSRAIVGGFEA